MLSPTPLNFLFVSFLKKFCKSVSHWMYGDLSVNKCPSKQTQIYQSIIFHVMALWDSHGFLLPGVNILVM